MAHLGGPRELLYVFGEVSQIFRHAQEFPECWGNDISEFTFQLSESFSHMALYGIEMYRTSWGFLEGISSHHGFNTWSTWEAMSKRLLLSFMRPAACAALQWLGGDQGDPRGKWPILGNQMWLTFFSRSGFKPSIGHRDLPTTSNCHIQAIQAIQAGYVTIKQWSMSPRCSSREDLWPNTSQGRCFVRYSWWTCILLSEEGSMGTCFVPHGLMSCGVECKWHQPKVTGWHPVSVLFTSQQCRN